MNLDNATKKLDQEANKVTGIDIRHVVNPDASDHKEALRDAREKLGIGHNNQQDNTELTGTTPEEHHEN
ncbi:hypothetical protein N7280_05805 [Rickettsia rhipicephali]|uniref:hypothetical protein n=1 Tax=Rickettsia rhipicephali TaxID=33992 RepID=UPI00224E520C|nr:hypothetical protein [Rickettsia rhipicephali]MCX4080092.1 hypothetical protein [Rickettsia rhipicephali]